MEPSRKEGNQDRLMHVEEKDDQRELQECL